MARKKRPTPPRRAPSSRGKKASPTAPASENAESVESDEESESEEDSTEDSSEEESTDNASDDSEPEAAEASEDASSESSEDESTDSEDESVEDESGEEEASDDDGISLDELVSDEESDSPFEATRGKLAPEDEELSRLLTETDEPETKTPSETDEDEAPESAEISADDFFGAGDEGIVGEGLDGDESEVEDTEEFLKGLVEAVLFISDKPLSARDVARSAKIDKKRAQELIERLVVETRSRGVRLVEVSEGFAYRTNAAYSPYVREFLSQRPVRLSRAQLETLAIIAYRQPVTRPEVDDIRGVDSGAVIKTLLERDLIRILGKKDEPGRPMLYGTTTQFLDLFSLKSLRDLPTLKEFTELTEDSRAKFELEIGEPAPEGPVSFDDEKPSDVVEEVAPVAELASEAESTDDESSDSEAESTDEETSSEDDEESDEDESDDDESDDDEDDEDEDEDEDESDDDDDDEESDDDDDDDDDDDEK